MQSRRKVVLDRAAARCSETPSADGGPRQGAKALLMDGTAVESAFALLLTKVTKPPYPAKISFYTIAGKDTNLSVMSGTGFRKWGDEHEAETNN